MGGEATLRSVEAERHRRARAVRRRCVAQDYVRGIAELIAERGEARVTDLSSRLGVAPATVSVQVRRLVDVGLARSERYRSIHLTPAGWRLAATCLARRAIVRDLLVALGVDRETAETDAEGMAHHASESTLAAIRNALACYGARQPTADPMKDPADRAAPGDCHGHGPEGARMRLP